jgi:hypothetical protein
MVQLIFRITGSLVLLAAAIFVLEYLSDSEFNNYLGVALIAFFVAAGPIYGVQKSCERIEDNEARLTGVVLSVIVQGMAALAGIVILIIGCLRLL